MKVLNYSAAFLIGALQFALFAQALDAPTYQNLKAYLVRTDGGPIEDLKDQVDKATPTPVPYLIALADDPTLRIYAKQRAIALLQFYESVAGEAYLEQKLGDQAAHPSLRNYAVKAYAEGVYKRKPDRADGVLRAQENDRRIGATVRKSLAEARSQSPSNAEPTPVRDLNRRKDFKKPR